MLRRLFICTLLGSSSLAVGGCVILGAAASKLPAPIVPAAYDDLAGKSVAVWVWVDPAVDLDYPTLSLELATAIQSGLEAARDVGSRGQQRALEETTFPIEPRSIVRYQKNDPLLNTLPVRDLAPRLGVERVIYVEVADFTTQGGAVVGLNRGTAEVGVTVVEIDAPVVGGTSDKARVGVVETAYAEGGLELAFPPGAAEGSNRLTPRQTYEGTLAEIAGTVVRKFIPHPQEPE